MSLVPSNFHKEKHKIKVFVSHRKTKNKKKVNNIVFTVEKKVLRLNIGSVIFVLKGYFEGFCVP